MTDVLIGESGYALGALSEHRRSFGDSLIRGAGHEPLEVGAWCWVDEDGSRTYALLEPYFRDPSGRPFYRQSLVEPWVRPEVVDEMHEVMTGLGLVLVAVDGDSLGGEWWVPADA